MKNSDKRIGELFIWGELLLWALFPILMSILIQNIPSILAIGLSTMAAGFFLFFYTVALKRHKELTNKKGLKYTLIATIIIGVINYSLYSIALNYTTPNNVAILGLSQLLFTILYFGIITKKEPQTSKNLFGAFLILIGTITVILKDGFQFNPGDLLIILANSMAPFANAAAQKARKHISGTSIMTIRSLIAGIFIIILSFIFEKPNEVKFTAESIGLILFIGIVLMGLSKIFWIESIHRIDISRALSFNSTGPAFTMVFSIIILNQIPTSKQIFGLIPMIIGIYLITAKSSGKKSDNSIDLKP